MTRNRAPSPRPARSRLSAADWERAALDGLAGEGLAGINIEALARRLGVTKGSFYWHFENRDALLQAALARWEEEDETAVAASLGRADEPRERLRELVREAARKRPSHAIFALLLRSQDEPRIRPWLERVSARRLAFVTRAFRDAGFDGSTAAHRARIVWSAYVGFVLLAPVGPRMSHEEFEAYIHDFMAALIPA